VVGWRLHTYVRAAGGTEALFVNGAIVATADTAATAAAAGIATLQLGGSSGADCYIAELLVFNVSLSTAIRQTVEAYLSSKYALPLPVTHPYNTTGVRPPPDPGASAAAPAPPTLATPLSIGGLQAWFRPDSFAVPGYAGAGGKAPYWANAVPRPELTAYADAPLLPLANASALCPVVSTALALNGYPVLAFARGQRLRVNISSIVGAPGAAGLTVVAVAAPLSLVGSPVGGVYGEWGMGSIGAAENTAFLAGDGSGSQVVVAANTTAAARAGTPLLPGTWRVWQLLVDSLSPLPPATAALPPSATLSASASLSPSASYTGSLTASPTLLKSASPTSLPFVAYPAFLNDLCGVTVGMSNIFTWRADSQNFRLGMAITLCVSGTLYWQQNNRN
jgi:hypothetical protein